MAWRQLPATQAQLAAVSADLASLQADVATLATDLEAVETGLADHAADATDPHSAAGYVDANGARGAAPVQADRWRSNLPQSPAGTVWSSRLTAVAEDLVGVLVMVPALGSTAGDYTVDVRVGGSTPAEGVSVLEGGAFDLMELDAGAWTPAPTAEDGSEQLEFGDTVNVWVVSDNGDLTGFGGGVVVELLYRARS